MKILLISAAPPALERLDIEYEVSEIRRQLKSVRHGDEILLVDRSGVNTQDLLELVRSEKPAILHFSGHGEKGGIVLRHPTEGYVVVSSGRIQRFLENREIKLLVLNACYSKTLAETALTSVKAIVGTSDGIEDRQAIIFSKVFYGMIAEGATLKRAFAEARTAVDLEGGDPEHFHLRGDDSLTFLPAPDVPSQSLTAASPAVALKPRRSTVSNRGQPELSHRLGSIHLHIDGAQAKDMVRSIIRMHEAAGYTAEYSVVSDFVAGLQRQSEPALYGFHTPGTGDNEELDLFSTTALYPGPNLPNEREWEAIRTATREALVQLYETERMSEQPRGVVVELERVAGTVDPLGNAQLAPQLEIGESGRWQLFAYDDMLFAPNYPGTPAVLANTWYELHFSLDFPKGLAAAPLSLQQLNEITLRAAITVGGWFLFEDAERWAYRSNGFEERVSAGFLANTWQQLNQALQSSGGEVPANYSLRLLAEESLAVWKSPLKKIGSTTYTVPELATWEATIAPLREFWVVAPNFLGDSDPMVNQAMTRNLDRGVHYTYFLRSSTDARRWLSFKSALELQLRYRPQMDAFVLAFDDDFWSSNLAFVANPRPLGAEKQVAMRLRIDPLKKRIVAGSIMPPAQVEVLLQRIEGTVGVNGIRRWEHVMEKHRPGNLAAMCVVLDRPLSTETNEYFDDLLATVVSLNQGDVVEYSATTVVVAFESDKGNVEAALRCASDMLKRTAKRDGDKLELRIGIDMSDACIVARAIGTVWEGAAIEGCRALLQHPEARGAPGDILLTAEAARRLKGERDQLLGIELVEQTGGFFKAKLSQPQAATPRRPEQQA